MTNPIKSPAPPPGRANADTPVSPKTSNASTRTGTKVAIGLAAIVASVAGWWSFTATQNFMPDQVPVAASSLNQSNQSIDVQPLPTLAPLSTVAPLTKLNPITAPQQAAPAVQPTTQPIQPQVQVQPQVQAVPQTNTGRVRPLGRTRSSR